MKIAMAGLMMALALAWTRGALAQGGTGPGAIDALATLQAVQAQATAQAITGQRDAAQAAASEAAAAAEAASAAARAAAARSAAASAAAAARAQATRAASDLQMEIAQAQATSNAAIMQATLAAQATRTSLDVQATQSALAAQATRQANDARATATVQASSAQATATAVYRAEQMAWQRDRQRNTLAWAGVILMIAAAVLVGWPVARTLGDWAMSFRPADRKPIVIVKPDDTPAREPSSSGARMPETVAVVDDPAMEEAIERWAQHYDQEHTDGN